MATLTVDLISGKVFLFNKDFISSGGTGVSGSTYQEVNLYSQLPPANLHNGDIYLVRTSSGAYVLNRKEAGLYYSNGITWRRLGDIPSFFSSTNFQIYDGIDNSKGINIQTSGITSGVFRTLTVQDSSGTIAYLTDLNTKVNLSAFTDYTGTTVPNTYLSINDFDIYSGQTFSLIFGKQDKLTPGKGIEITTGNTINVVLPNSLQLIDISGGTQVNTIQHTPISWTTQEYSGTSLNFTGGSRIYVLETGLFELSYVLNLEFGSGGDKNIGTVIKKNGTTFITQLTSSSFVRNNSISGSNTMPAYKVNLSAGDYVELVAFRIGSAGSVTTVGNGSWIKINKLL